MKELVSIISPCYNVGEYIERFLDSILNQTYTNIEVILINDGSTDNTEDIILSYREKFEAKGYLFKYVVQDNAGQSAAINKGLSLFTGGYMTWLDSDDALAYDAIMKKVSYMDSHPEVGLLVSKVDVVADRSFSHLRYQSRIKPSGDDRLFFDLISGTNVFYTPGGYMVRSSMFRDVMPNPLQIEAPREIGQNFQLLLPIAYKYPIGYIDDVTYFYTVRETSHSHLKHSFDEHMQILDISKKVLYHIAEHVEKKEKECKKIKNAIDVRISKAIINKMYLYHRTDHLDDEINCLKKNRSYTREIQKTAFQIKYPAFRFVFRIIHRFMKQ